MKLTTEDRHAIYKKMLQAALKDPSVSYGFCYLHSQKARIFSKFKDLKELISFQPTNYNPIVHIDSSYYWFPCTTKGWEKRIEILLKCMELTKPKAHDKKAR